MWGRYRRLQVYPNVGSLQSRRDWGAGAQEGGHRYSRLGGNAPGSVDGGHLAWLGGFCVGFLEGLGGRGLGSEGDDVLAPDDDETEGPLDLLVDSGLVGLGDPVLLGVGEDDVHVLVKGEEGADHHPPVLDGDPHPEVDPLQELASLSRHL